MKYTSDSLECSNERRTTKSNKTPKHDPLEFFKENLGELELCLKKIDFNKISLMEKNWGLLGITKCPQKMGMRDRHTQLWSDY